MSLASKIIEVAIQLKDLFSGKVGNVTKGYDKLAKSSKKNAKEIETQNDKITKSFKSLGSGIAGLAATIAGGFSISAALSSLQDFVSEVDALNKEGEKLGLTTDQLQTFGAIAERSGVSADTAVTGIQRFIRRLAEVEETGTGPAVAGLEALGLTIDDFDGTSFEDQLKLLADAFASIDDQGTKVLAGYKLFDKSGVDLIRVFQGGSNAVSELNRQVEDFAVTYSGDFADNASLLADKLQSAEGALGKFTDGIKTGATILAGSFLEKFGIYANDLDRLNASLEDQYEELETLKSLNVGGIFDSLIEARKESIKQTLNEKAALVELQGEEEKAAQSKQDELAARREYNKEVEQGAEEVQKAIDEQAKAEEEAAKVRADAIDGIVKALEKQTEDAEKELEKQTEELRKARTAQAELEQEFEDRIDDIFDNISADNADVLDFYEEIQDANEALKDQEFGIAERDLNKAADVLEALADSGKLSAATLFSLQRDLEGWVRTVGDAQVQAELLDVREAESELESLRRQLAEASKLQLQLDPDSALVAAEQTKEILRIAIQEGVSQGLTGGSAIGSAGLASDIAREVALRGCNA